MCRLPTKPKVQSPRPELKKGKSEIANTTVISSDEGAGQLGYAYFSDGRVKCPKIIKMSLEISYNVK